jgi:homospermidine synthase
LCKQLWAHLSSLLNVQVIQVTERDTLVSNIPRPKGTFICTWSPAGLAEEAIAPAELGWGTHETMKDGVYRYSKGPKNQVCFSTRGWNTHIESFTPVNGNFMASCIRHEEAYSLSDYFTDHSTSGKVTYRPTVYYAYLPCDQCVASMQELQSNGYKYPSKDRIPRDDVISGEDEVGIFLLSRDYGEYYLGTKQTIEQSRKLLPHQSPTLLVVAAGVLSGIIYAFNHPNLGIIHPEECNEEEMIQMISPYWYPMIGGHIQGWKPIIKSNYDEDKNKMKTKDWIYEKLRL